MSKLGFADRLIITTVLFVALAISLFQIVAHPIGIVIDAVFSISARVFKRIGEGLMLWP